MIVKGGRKTSWTICGSPNIDNESLTRKGTKGKKTLEKDLSVPKEEVELQHGERKRGQRNALNPAKSVPERRERAIKSESSKGGQRPDVKTKTLGGEVESVAYYKGFQTRIAA